MAYLLASADQIMTGQTYGKSHVSKAYVLVENGSNTAGVSLQVGANAADHFLALTAWVLTPGQTATAQIIDMYLPWVKGSVDWVSGGATNVNMIYQDIGRGD